MEIIVKLTGNSEAHLGPKITKWPRKLLNHESCIHSQGRLTDINSKRFRNDGT